MPELSEKYFEGKCDIPAKKVKELLTKGNEDSVIETLTKLGWEGQLIATVNLKLAAERRRADDGQVMGKGRQRRHDPDRHPPRPIAQIRRGKPVQ